MMTPDAGTRTFARAGVIPSDSTCKDTSSPSDRLAISNSPLASDEAVTISNVRSIATMLAPDTGRCCGSSTRPRTVAGVPSLTDGSSFTTPARM